MMRLIKILGKNYYFSNIFWKYSKNQYFFIHLSLKSNISNFYGYFRIQHIRTYKKSFNFQNNKILFISFIVLVFLFC